MHVLTIPSVGYKKAAQLGTSMDTAASTKPGVVDASKGALFVLFLVTVIDMIGFGIVIPFLTYLVEDLTPASQELSLIHI